MKVRIIGGLSKRENFPEEREEGTEVWGLNGIRPRWIRRWDRMFNIHTYENLVKYKYPVEHDADWSEQHPLVPFYTSDEWPVPNQLVGQRIFPRAELANMGLRGDYHCGSFDWLVAFALHEGAKEIVIHGFSANMGEGEPISARPCLEYWCGIAEGRGCKITTTKDTNLFAFYHYVKSHMVYGYDDTPIIEDRTRPGEQPYHYGE